MPKYRLTTLSPVHISSGKEYELNYNLLEKDGLVYLYDEFRLVEFFIAHDITVPSNINELKKLVSTKSDDIIASGLHRRRIESNFSKPTKPLLENITTAENPIVTGSSIKGSLRTAILDCMANDQENCKNIIKNFKDKNFDKQRFNKRFDNDLATIFKYLKVTDSLLPLETKVYKTINMKKNRDHQSSRGKKVEEISNYVEAIKPNQSFEVEISDTHDNKIFEKLNVICNKFYIPFFANDEKQYFTKKSDRVEKAKSANKAMFIINVGRFGGAESKSLNNIRFIKASKADDKSITSARTFALEQSTDEQTYFENQLLPFGWVMCEKIDEQSKEERDSMLLVKNKAIKEKEDKYQAIENLNIIQSQKLEESKAAVLQKQKELEEKQRKEAKAKAEKEAKLAAMSPAEKIIDSFGNDIPTVINAMKNGSVENLNEIKKELAQALKELMQKDPKQWEKAKQKALKRKEYIENILQQ